MWVCGGDLTDSDADSRRHGFGRGSPSFDLRAATNLPKLTNRRTQDDVKRLVYHFKQWIETVDGARERLLHFWKDIDSQESALAALAHDIPRDADPLSPPRREEESACETSKKKKFQSHGFDDCVLWLGLVNQHNRYAAVQLKLPETFDPWVTYVNRVMVYLFAEIPGYQGPDDFHRLLNVALDEPFPMKCHNPLCVRLDHIDYLRRPPSADEDEEDNDNEEDEDES
ncbi:hypothetical protein BESB_071130 [Besnoitia besnoiti]|uniref:Uncharacterized protein n=1 Tax=Besnoitia besnoiti TaxID=94643 RepID=A0A2A9MCB6_BESBE|nr:uncharacterized protein BESB_071130 [Besnoitia besnoiti]PFH33961.1 hypothetical protein BESB_071130 [Besnoitia besnoiti]